MKANLYRNSAHLYDIGNNRDVIDGDVAFYLDSIGKGCTVLEIGCGTGRVTIPLAKHGNRIVGLDLSQDMLTVFENKLAYENCADNISLLLGDMESFDLADTFDWIIFPFRAFQALTSNASRVSCLESVKRHMHDNTRIVLNLFNPNDEILKVWGRKNILDFEGVDENTGCLVKRYQDQLSIDTKEQVIASRFTFKVYDNDKLIETKADDLLLGYLYPDQCEKLFESCGLKIEQAYGGYDKSAIMEDEKKELIYVLTKKHALLD